MSKKLNKIKISDQEYEIDLVPTTDLKITSLSVNTHVEASTISSDTILSNVIATNNINTSSATISRLTIANNNISTTITPISISTSAITTDLIHIEDGKITTKNKFTVSPTKNTFSFPNKGGTIALKSDIPEAPKYYRHNIFIRGNWGNTTKYYICLRLTKISTDGYNYGSINQIIDAANGSDRPLQVEYSTPCFGTIFSGSYYNTVIGALIDTNGMDICFYYTSNSNLANGNVIEYITTAISSGFYITDNVEEIK